MRTAETKSEGPLAPEPDTEDAARRELSNTEKELNALIAKDEATARRVAIALSTDMVSVKLVVPVDDDFPVLGGKTLRLNCGITGNIKNVDLVREFGGQGGFWDLFSRGVEDIKVLDGSLFVKLREWLAWTEYRTPRLHLLFP